MKNRTTLKIKSSYLWGRAIGDSFHPRHSHRKCIEKLLNTNTPKLGDKPNQYQRNMNPSQTPTHKAYREIFKLADETRDRISKSDDTDERNILSQRLTAYKEILTSNGDTPFEVLDELRDILKHSKSEREKETILLRLTSYKEMILNTV